MPVYAGIDEAGYGPILGPLVIARAVFRFPRLRPDGQPPCLWEALAGAVSRRVPARGGRSRRSAGADSDDPASPLAVNDSKQLYVSGRGLYALERGVLGFLAASGKRPRSLAQLLELLSIDHGAQPHGLPWYRDAGGAPVLPTEVPVPSLEAARGVLRAAADAASVELADLRASVVFADRLNALMAQTGSKAAAAWQFTAAHLRDIWATYGRDSATVVVDHCAGRRNYRHALAELFAGARFRVAEESAGRSRYTIHGNGRSMDLSFQVRGDEAHLPTALASMTAKYLRELFMIRFKKYWSREAPQVRSTCGYYADGRRFLAEIEPLLVEMKIDRLSLIRSS